jgi:protocatechuate 3,4-dioxygenase beta subunit
MAPTFSISGVVADAEGRPVENARIMLRPDALLGIPTFTPPPPIRTATDGSFTIEGIFSGIYGLSAAAPEYQFDRADEVRVTIEGEDVAGVQVVAKRAR